MHISIIIYGYIQILIGYIQILIAAIYKYQSNYIHILILEEDNFPQYLLLVYSSPSLYFHSPFFFFSTVDFPFLPFLSLLPLPLPFLFPLFFLSSPMSLPQSSPKGRKSNVTPAPSSLCRSRPHACPEPCHAHLNHKHSPFRAQS